MGTHARECRAVPSELLSGATSNLSEAHKTRDSSGPATLVVSVCLQQ